MITLVCQDRNGYPLETLIVDPKDEVKTRKVLVEKYKSLYIFAAEPSRDHSLGPSRMVTARRFSMVAE
jgi:hypothetical protein